MGAPDYRRVLTDAEARKTAPSPGEIVMIEPAPAPLHDGFLLGFLAGVAVSIAMLVVIVQFIKAGAM
jgi:hypothetical protein